ncbi:23S rRNA (adenine(2503)-C(2))-methyltransferase RlmN [Paraliomyxa miuraensis]|uniref:23S rRNA (adenine(2503)-C(2))-methyltransferase RlmN n=1 Tax=Paraliomyxa miuraensis TaxID=376150 RepID=UPI0022566F2F|nr:23S rRNA (adenine(2503)-C(2))-methyltransferase RlmN [Paraliomyxa miuraensis]MCX4245716.1 23S rRNA (adenine(2503)-C(2))-methyltransferase RlmN [Paraliomyxa miuraensis]
MPPAATDRSYGELVAIRPPRRGLPKPARPALRDLPREELGRFMAEHLPGPAFRTTQIFEWLHRHRVPDFDAMTNIGRADRVRLHEHASLPALTVDAVQRSRDGTRKLRLLTPDGHAIESVLIPNDGRGLTQCVSSMVGCSLTCRFCATATLGFERNLATWEIVDQVYRAQDFLASEAAEQGARYVARITNLVFMGMGEPLHNYGQVKRALSILTDERGAAIAGRRITVSTSGLVPAIERFGREGLGREVGLAISLNASTDEVRDRVMPINTRWNIAALLQAVRGMPTPKRRRVTFEYVLLAEVNDEPADARRLGRLLRDVCGGGAGHLNVIPWNPHPGAPFRRPSEDRVRTFVQACRRAGLEVHVRTPRGDDIAAACGQLALEGSTPSAASATMEGP